MDYPCVIYYTDDVIYDVCRRLSFQSLQSMLSAQITQCQLLPLPTWICSGLDYKRNFSANIRNTFSMNSL